MELGQNDKTLTKFCSTLLIFSEMSVPGLNLFSIITLKRTSYDILGMLTLSSVAGMQLIMWGENMIA